MPEKCQDYTYIKILMGNMLIIVFSHYVPILLYAGYNGKIKKQQCLPSSVTENELLVPAAILIHFLFCNLGMGSNTSASPDFSPRPNL